MRKEDYEFEQHTVCIYNQGVDCTDTDGCVHCGWDPAESKARRAKLYERNHKMIINIPERPLEPPETNRPDPHCPVCGKLCDTFYKQDGEIIGCEVCVIPIDAYPEEDEDER